MLYHLVESLAHLTVLLSPVLPEPLTRLSNQLRMENLGSLKLDDLQWGLVPDGHQTGKPKPVFPRIVIEDAE